MFIAAYSLVSINIVFTAYSLVLAEVIFCSLYGLILVKKDCFFVGVLNSYQVLSSTVPVASVTGCIKALQAVLALLIA